MRYKCEQCGAIWNQDELDGQTFCLECFENVIPLKENDDDIYNEDEDIYANDDYEEDFNDNYDDQQLTEEYEQQEEY